MTLKKWKIISVFLIFGLSGLFHFIYTWFPSSFTALFFPVNESIGEHNKIIVLSFLVLALAEKLYYKREKNTLFAGLISGVLCSFLVMLIFTPIYLYILNTQDNMIVTFVVFLMAISFSEYVNYKILELDYDPILERISVYLWILVFTVNALMTFYPPNIAIYYDFNQDIYGIK